MYSSEADVNVLPAIPVHALSPRHSIDSFEPTLRRQLDTTELPRSASSTDIHRDGAALSNGLKRTYSENILSLSPEPANRPNGTGYVANKELLRRASRKAKSRLSGAIFSLPPDSDNGDSMRTEARQSHVETSEPAKGPSRSVTGTIRSIARKSFLSSASRSPSPAPSPGEPTRPEKKRSRSPFKRNSIAVTEIISVPAPTLSRNMSLSSMITQDGPRKSEASETLKAGRPTISPLARPTSFMGLKNKSEADLRLQRTPSTRSLRSRSSVEQFHAKLSSMKVPRIPSSLSSDRLSAASFDIGKKKDPLWAAFRALDGDFINFQSKSSAHKAKVIRSSLLPFLKDHANHLSNETIRAEDLDRRVMILNKWWTGLLEMLNGRNNQSISGTDRPTFLDAVTGIMMRPEWRMSPFSSAEPPDTPQLRPPIPKSRSTNSLANSLASNDSGFLLDSIYHNVRNVFIQNLLSQMAYVVERMSMRNAPASLVSFCGKACAYAFFFCPGIADILVRLWHIPIGTLRRVFAEFGVERGFNFHDISKVMAAKFPPPIQSLRVASQAGLARHLQHRAPLPLGASYIRWYGPWVGRWSGRDSDLFFVFTKHFHQLVSEHIPENTDMPSMACVPGLVPVLSQILTVLESTIYRQAGQHTPESFTSGSVDDGNNPDAVAPIPMTIANAARSMAENRLIMLLREIIGNNLPERLQMRDVYLRSFNGVLKASCRKVSLYDNEACFVLCDLLEEVLPLLSRYQSSQPDSEVLDWTFWLSVCKKMMQSHNTLTKVRLIAFLYSMWNVLICNEQTKYEVCLDWILGPAFFQEHFSHWCPMVRHYFQRLLCWRMARHDGVASDLDMEIYETFGARLNVCWAHYSYLKAEAEMRETVPPSSAPCGPAPNRRLVIIRTDSQPAPVFNMFLLEKIMPSRTTNQITPYQSHSSLLNTVPVADSPTQNKKRWGLLKGILPAFTASGNNRPGEVTPPKLDSTIINGNGSVDDISTGGHGVPPKSRPVTPPHQAFSFKFSLEWVDRSQWPAKNKGLRVPALPAMTQVLVQLHREQTVPVKPLKPSSQELGTTKYAGRALAEWEIVVREYDNFLTRRREEGVPSTRLVETPTLGVESFRMFG